MLRQPRDYTEIKAELYITLTLIQQLPQDLMKAAIRRLYLKWHPDKNLDNIDKAEDVFKYLNQQIEHLNKGEPLDNPEGFA